MRCAAAQVALALLMVPATAVAQQVHGLPAGARVRVTAPALGMDQAVGTLAEQRGDTLMLRGVQGSPESGGIVPVPLARVARLEVSRGSNPRGSGALKGMGIGILSGVAAGLVGAGLMTSGDKNCNDCELAFVALPLYGGGAGAVLGGLLGAASPGERWERVPLAPRAGLLPRPGGGFGLALTHRF